MKNTRKGFTLVELLVVIAILAILATVGVAGYTAFISRAEESNAQTEAHQINSAIDSFLMIDDEYVFFTDDVLPTKAAPTEKVVKIYAKLDGNGDIVVMQMTASWNEVADDPSTAEDESLKSRVKYAELAYEGEISLKGTDFEALEGRLYSYEGGKLGYVYDLGADATIGTDDDAYVPVK